MDPELRSVLQIVAAVALISAPAPFLPDPASLIYILVVAGLVLVAVIVMMFAGGDGADDAFPFMLGAALVPVAAGYGIGWVVNRVLFEVEPLAPLAAFYNQNPTAFIVAGSLAAAALVLVALRRFLFQSSNLLKGAAWVAGIAGSGGVALLMGPADLATMSWYEGEAYFFTLSVLFGMYAGALSIVAALVHWGAGAAARQLGLSDVEE